MGRVLRTYLDHAKHLYVCSTCNLHLTDLEYIISRSFTGRYGKAILVADAVNVLTGPPEDRHLMTGLHTVRDLFCIGCGQLVGWKYDYAHEPDQKYKEGKYIIETGRSRKEEQHPIPPASSVANVAHLLGNPSP
jgi:hypothetical protein